MALILTDIHNVYDSGDGSTCTLKFRVTDRATGFDVMNNLKLWIGCGLDSITFNAGVDKQPCITNKSNYGLFDIKKVIYNNPATIVLWEDGTKTIVKCQDNDTYDPEKGLAMCFAKKALGNKGHYMQTFKKWGNDDIIITEYLDNSSIGEAVTHWLSSLGLKASDSDKTGGEE